MKLKITSTIFGLCLMSIFFMSNSSGRAAAAGQGNTGAPGDGAMLCSNCHIGGNFGPSIDIKILDADGTTVTEYIPGATYELVASISTINAPAGYGLQLVSLIDADETDTGGLANPSSNAQLSSLNSRVYLEQKSLSSSGDFTADWTAPSEAVGSVSFYAAGHAANGNGASGGDASTTAKTTLSQLPLAIDEYQALGTTLSPNPTVDYSTISLDKSITGTIEVIDITGKRISSATINNSDMYVLDLSERKTGLYFVKVTDLDSNVFETMRVIKK